MRYDKLFMHVKICHFINRNHSRLKNEIIDYYRHLIEIFNYQETRICMSMSDIVHCRQDDEGSSNGDRLKRGWGAARDRTGEKPSAMDGWSECFLNENCKIAHCDLIYERSHWLRP